MWEMTERELKNYQVIRKDFEILRRAEAEIDPVTLPDEVLQTIRQRLMDAATKALDMRLAIEDFIDTIDNSLTRQIIGLRYIDCRTWEQVGKHLGITADAVKQHNRRFFLKQKGA
jgi:DNA-directed RNA polymerase specialized sigma24 family protein